MRKKYSGASEWSKDGNHMDKEIIQVFSLFLDEVPAAVQTLDTSHGEEDYRGTFIIETESGNKYVLKLADNDFTLPERITIWQRTVEEYRKLGYYCPRIIADKSGSFPRVDYEGHKCTAYVEEYAPYQPAEDRFAENGENAKTPYDTYKRDIWQMTARIAALYLDYSKYPSAYCLFETFCPSDKMDEVLENALDWKAYTDTLPEVFREQTERIWKLWTDNRAALEKIYDQFPTSVFQADLNSSNILIDEDGRFVGIYDFNLCGRDVFLNYLIRECNGADDICGALKIAAEYYHFSDFEKDTALMLYRCLKPLWYSEVDDLKELGDDWKAVHAFLDKTEHMLTDPIDFRPSME